jgi:hypothetical protein
LPCDRWGVSWRWAQSIANSSLDRIPDRQGKCREVVQIPASGEASVSDPAPLDVLAGEFPTFGNREFPTNEQGLP